MAGGQTFLKGIIDRATAQGTNRLIDSSGAIADAGNSVFNALTGWLGNAKGAAARYGGRTYQTPKEALNEIIMPLEKDLQAKKTALNNYTKDASGKLQVKDKEGNLKDVTQEEKDKYDKLQKEIDDLKEQITYNRTNGVVEDSSNQLSAGERFAGMFLNDEGKFSGYRLAGGVAGSYMAANIIGHGSLGIPLLSTASWNR